MVTDSEMTVIALLGESGGQRGSCPCPMAPQRSGGAVPVLEGTGLAQVFPSAAVLLGFVLGSQQVLYPTDLRGLLFVPSLLLCSALELSPASFPAFCL